MGLINELAKPQDEQTIKQLYEKENKIKELKHQRFYLRDKIRGRLKKGYDKAYVKSDIIKFNDIIQQLLDLGVDTWVECDYLKLENYKDVEAKEKPKPQKKSTIFKETVVKKKKSTKQPEPKQAKQKPTKSVIETPKIFEQAILSDKPAENNYYILNLAWTEKLSDGIDYNPITDVVKKYFEEIGIKQISDETSNIGDVMKDHIVKYEIQGDDKYFKLIKISSQYLLDSHNKDNYDIAIYGKKRNY